MLFVGIRPSLRLNSGYVTSIAFNSRRPIAGNACVHPSSSGVSMPSNESPLIRAIAYFGTGGQSRLADELTHWTRRPITRQHVNKWLNQGQQMPAEIALAIEALVDRTVTAAELRPDLAQFFETLARHQSVADRRYQVGRKAMEH